MRHDSAFEDELDTLDDRFPTRCRSITEEEFAILNAIIKKGGLSTEELKLLAHHAGEVRKLVTRLAEEKQRAEYLQTLKGCDRLRVVYVYCGWTCSDVAWEEACADGRIPVVDAIPVDALVQCMYSTWDLSATEDVTSQRFPTHGRVRLRAVRVECFPYPERPVSVKEQEERFDSRGGRADAALALAIAFGTPELLHQHVVIFSKAEAHDSQGRALFLGSHPSGQNGWEPAFGLIVESAIQHGENYHSCRVIDEKEILIT